jgi:hypothetical protein
VVQSRLIEAMEQVSTWPAITRVVDRVVHRVIPGATADASCFPNWCVYCSQCPGWLCGFCWPWQTVIRYDCDCGPPPYWTHYCCSRLVKQSCCV